MMQRLNGDNNKKLLTESDMAKREAFGDFVIFLIEVMNNIKEKYGTDIARKVYMELWLDFNSIMLINYRIDRNNLKKPIDTLERIKTQRQIINLIGKVFREVK